MTLRKAFDGEVYYWYEDDLTVRREMSRVDPLRFVNAKIYTQADLDQARKEAREAAFRDARKAIDNMEVVITRFQKRSADMNGWYSAIEQAHKAIEAAANTEERGGDER